MVGKINLHSGFIVFGIPVLLFSALIIFVKSPIFIPEIALFVTLDFLVVIPLIYFLLIRKKDISKKFRKAFERDCSVYSVKLSQGTQLVH